MEPTERQRLRRGLTLGGLCGLGIVNVALAAPPLHRLDLRPPALPSLETGTTPNSPFLRQSRSGVEAARDRLPGFEPMLSPAPRGRLEDIARRVPQEGVPFARLWENKSALVSLGLNQRGKPGLWIIQKTH
jgi:hypothetical protein